MSATRRWVADTGEVSAATSPSKQSEFEAPRRPLPVVRRDPVLRLSEDKPSAIHTLHLYASGPRRPVLRVSYRLGATSTRGAHA